MMILCAVDRAFRYIRVMKTNLMYYLSSVYFVNQPLFRECLQPISRRYTCTVCVCVCVFVCVCVCIYIYIYIYIYTIRMCCAQNADSQSAKVYPSYNQSRANWVLVFGKISQGPQLDFNLQAPRVLYIGQEIRYSPENAFYIFNHQIYFII